MKQFLGLLYLIVLTFGEGETNDDCDAMEIYSVDSGATWVYVEWKLHCNISHSDNVRNYNLALIDNTSPDHWYDANVNPDCRLIDCAINVTLAHPCVNYTVNLKVVDEDGEEFFYNDKDTETGEEYPSEVRHLTVDETTKTSVKISWNPPHVGQFCVHHYMVCHREIPSSKTLATCSDVTTDKDDPSLSIEDLTACHSYYITVVAVTKMGKLGKKEAIIGNTLDDAPGTPQHIGLKEAAHDFIAFYWDVPDSNLDCINGIAEVCKVSSANNAIKGSYQQDRRKRITAVKMENKHNKLVGNKYSEVTNLLECTFYDCWVELLHSEDGRVISENITSFTNVIGVTISKPTGVEVIEADKNFLEVAWAFPEQGSRCVDGYRLSWESNEGVQNETEVENDVLEYKIENLLPCSTYNIAIAGFSNSWGHNKDGQQENISHNTSFIAPGKVGNLQVLEDLTTQTEVTISWEYPAENPQCVNTWNVQLSHGMLDEDCDPETKVFERHQSINHKISCLICGNTYTFSVEAVAENGSLSKSSSVSAKTENCTF